MPVFLRPVKTVLFDHQKKMGLSRRNRGVNRACSTIGERSLLLGLVLIRRDKQGTK